ncbi:NAD-dependent epimerase/dehydratase family protein [Modestobacter sp. I12A-02628]|uniref:NAD-dependent epimerase/dehydratase family protein n=1 Tax=Goekera deserti TaxID=2497753 RepID=A0A7K3W8R4_9ACTN|nr:NAD-dependent epimerase/dehydratase family protein [Goekera deserti]MPR00487.1 NAD-dependent epimerase/dehydratase family protein [Goekera deserti]NDI49114.1 NAD-dependent epimerase/dehydratase family protein [Goekera deserti]NEL52852.1 NAD-dependent epimerase/dehydratase family protein [Goekera deserti]
MPPAVVLVTGVSRWLGGALAGELAADSSIERVIGVDTVPPSPEVLRRLGRTEFVRADIRNPLIGKVITGASVDTVVHMNISATPGGSGGRTSMKELNVIGTMQLLAACQAAPSVRRLVLKSTSAVYGASSRDPAVFTESMQARRVPGGGFAKDSLDIEGYVRSFARRRPDVDVAVLRFTNFIGPRIDSLLTTFFRMPLVPTALGYDARVQLLHEDDALAVLTRATTQDFTGTVNVGGDGTLLLSQAIRRVGRVPVPLPTPAMGSIGRLTRGGSLVDYSPEQMRFLNFGRVVDTTVLREEFGYTPRYTTVAALADFARTVQPVVPPALVDGVAGRALSLLDGLARVSESVAERRRPAPPSIPLRAVRDA